MPRPPGDSVVGTVAVLASAASYVLVSAIVGAVVRSGECDANKDILRDNPCPRCHDEGGRDGHIDWPEGYAFGTIVLHRYRVQLSQRTEA